MNLQTHFFVVALLLALLSTALAVFILISRRYAILKPTFYISLWMLLQSWGAVVFSELVCTSLANPWHFIGVIQVPTLALLVISLFSVDRPAREAWGRMARGGGAQYWALRRTLPLVLCLSALCMVIYFVYVPPLQTGLIAAFKYRDALVSRDVREESLKLLPAIPRYVFSFNRDVLAHLGAAMLAVMLATRWRARVAMRRSVGILFLVVCVTLLLYLMIAASIYGARGPGGKVLLTFILAILLYKMLPLNPLYVGTGALAVLVLPTLISLIRKGAEFTPVSLWTEFVEIILPRVLETPIVAGLFHMAQTQTYGAWGIAAVPKLAWLFDVPAVNVDNLLAVEFGFSAGTGHLTVGSFVANYCNWGLVAGVSLSIAGPWMLNSIVHVYRYFKTEILLPAILVLLQASAGVVGGRLETVFITRGLIPGLVILLLLNAYIRSQFRSRSHSRRVVRQCA